MTKSVLLAFFLASFPAIAQEKTDSAPLQVPTTPVAPASPAAVEPEIPDDGVRVAILGYHEMAENQPETAMRIRTSKFRKQMETLRQLGLKVISLDEFTAWKDEGKEIPKKSVLLTFDDGWKSVYSDAYPILHEFGYPFTIFLYKNYVDGGGKALTSPMIEEMIANGASVGSHSVSHPYPITVKSFRKKGEKAFDAYLRKEMGESKRFLESRFPAKVTSYAYPGGFYTQEMLTLGEEFGYRHLFTVIPGKIKRSLPNETLPRYIILGNYDKIFDLATTFSESQGPGLAGGTFTGELSELAPTTPYPVTPEAGAIVNSRLPDISADLSTISGLDPTTLVMKVAGFGEVPATYSADTGKFSWQVNRRLRQATCQVIVTWKDPATGKSVEPPLRWSFQLDREAAYLPDGE